MDSVSPSSRTLKPGQTGHFQFHAKMPSAAGDSAHDLVVSDSSGDSTVVPVVLRSLVATNKHGGTFDGTLLGGNGREFVAQTDTFQFDVPKNAKSLSVSLSWPDNAGTEVIGWLIDPAGTLLGSASSLYVDPNTGAATFTHGLETFAASPRAGRWKFVVTPTSPVGGTVLSTPYHGVVSFDQPAIHARRRGRRRADGPAAPESAARRARRPRLRRRSALRGRPSNRASCSFLAVILPRS